MAVTIKGGDLIIPIEKIDKVYKGGFKAFLKDAPKNFPNEFWFDEHLLCIHWGESCLSYFEKLGLEFVGSDIHNYTYYIDMMYRDAMLVKTGYTSFDTRNPYWLEPGSMGPKMKMKGKEDFMEYPNEFFHSFGVPVKGKEKEAKVIDEKSQDYFQAPTDGHVVEVKIGSEDEVIKSLQKRGYQSKTKLEPLTSGSLWKGFGKEWVILKNEKVKEAPENIYFEFALSAKEQYKVSLEFNKSLTYLEFLENSYNENIESKDNPKSCLLGKVDRTCGDYLTIPSKVF